MRRGHGLWSHRTLSPALLGPGSPLPLARHCTSRDDRAAYCPNMACVLIKLRCQKLPSQALRLDEFTRVSHALRHVPSTCLPSRSASKYEALVSRRARRRIDGDTGERSAVDLSLMQVISSMSGYQPTPPRATLERTDQGLEKSSSNHEPRWKMFLQTEPRDAEEATASSPPRRSDAPNEGWDRS